MEISVSLWSYVELINANKITVEGAIRHMHQHGVKYVELLDYFLPTRESKEQAKQLVKELGMKVASYSISNNFVCDEETRKKQIEVVKEACDFANYFDTKTIRVFCGDCSETYTFDTAFDLIVKSFKECCIVAEQKNVYFCLENHGLLAGKASQIKRILETVNSDHLLTTIDTGNYLLVNEDAVMAAKTLKGKVGLVHFKDFKKVEKEHAKYHGIGVYVVGKVVAEGDVKMQEVVNTLAHNGYDGCLSIEYEGESSLEAVEKCIVNAFNLLKNFE